MFSVVVPVFNKQDFVSRTVESVLRQSFRDFELIVVDDGSTDATAQILERYSDPRLIVVRQANAGEGGARNGGMMRASRPWIALLDGDDYWFPDHLAELARVIHAFPEIGMAATSYVEGEEWLADPPVQPDGRIRRVDYFKAAAHKIGVVTSSTAALRADVVRQVGGFGSFRRGADLEYWARMAVAAPVAISSRVTAYYYRNPQSVMVTDHFKKEAPPARLEDIWPPLAYLRTLDPKTMQRTSTASINAYWRNAAYYSMIGYISRGEISVARRLSKGLPPGKLDKAAMVAAVLRLPDPAVRAALQIHRLLRRRGKDDRR